MIATAMASDLPRDLGTSLKPLLLAADALTATFFACFRFFFDIGVLSGDLPYSSALISSAVSTLPWDTTLPFTSIAGVDMTPASAMAAGSVT